MLRQDWFSMQKDRRSCCKSQALHCEQQFALMLLECADGAAVLGKAGDDARRQCSLFSIQVYWEHGYCTYQWYQESKLGFTCWTLQYSFSSTIENSTSHVKYHKVVQGYSQSSALLKAGCKAPRWGQEVVIYFDQLCSRSLTCSLTPAGFKRAHQPDRVPGHSTSDCSLCRS